MKSLKKLNLNSMQVSKPVASSALDKFFAVADKEIKVTILKRQFIFGIKVLPLKCQNILTKLKKTTKSYEIN